MINPVEKIHPIAVLYQKGITQEKLRFHLIIVDLP